MKTKFISKRQLIQKSSLPSNQFLNLIVVHPILPFYWSSTPWLIEKCNQRQEISNVRSKEFIFKGNYFCIFVNSISKQIFWKRLHWYKCNKWIFMNNSKTLEYKAKIPLYSFLHKIKFPSDISKLSSLVKIQNNICVFTV